MTLAFQINVTVLLFAGSDWSSGRTLDCSVAISCFLSTLPGNKPILCSVIVPESNIINMS